MNYLPQFIYKLASPRIFYNLSGRCIPWLKLSFIILIFYGLCGGLLLSPPDYQQGDGYRIIYLHVPAAVMSLFIYVVMAISASIFLIWRIKLADIIAQASAPIGAWLTLLALLTGSLWGRPMWGAWWIWDARLTSELILLFLYIGAIALRNAINNREQAAKSIAILTVVGLVDIPIIHYSVYWWNTLHQGATLLKFQKPTIAPTMLYPLLAMLMAFFLFYLLILCLRTRVIILERERKSKWVTQLR